MYTQPPNNQSLLTPNNYGLSENRQVLGGQSRIDTKQDNQRHEYQANEYENNRVENIIEMRKSQKKQSREVSQIPDDNMSSIFDGKLDIQETNSSMDNMTLPSQPDMQLRFERIYNDNQNVKSISNPKDFIPPPSPPEKIGKKVPLTEEQRRINANIAAKKFRDKKAGERINEQRFDDVQSNNTTILNTTQINKKKPGPKKKPG
jgi:hypothetical protein